jgi:hypothetical protein
MPRETIEANVRPTSGDYRFLQPERLSRLLKEDLRSLVESEVAYLPSFQASASPTWEPLHEGAIVNWFPVSNGRYDHMRACSVAMPVSVDESSGWQRLQERLDSFVSLPHGWDGYSGDPIPLEIVQVAKLLAFILRNQGYMPLNSDPIAGGSIMLSARSSNGIVLDCEIIDLENFGLVLRKPGEVKYLDASQIGEVFTIIESITHERPSRSSLRFYWNSDSFALTEQNGNWSI